MGSWTGTSPRGIYKPTIDEDAGIESTGAWKNFDTSLTNIHNKLWRDNVINVKADYELVGDGGTLETTNVRAAIAAWEADNLKKRLYFPSGTYLIDPLTITAPSNNLSAYIMGDGKSTIFKANGAEDMFTINMGAGSWQQLRVEGIGFDFNANDARAIVTTGNSGLKAKYENIWITGHSGTATKASIDLGVNDHVVDLINVNINGHSNKVGTGININSNVINIDHCNIILMDKAINIGSAVTGIRVTQNRLDQNNYGVYANLKHTVNLHILRNEFETIGEAAVWLVGAGGVNNIFNTEVIGNYFSAIANGKYGCYFQNMDALEVKNNRFDGVSGAVSIGWIGTTSNCSLFQNTVGESGMGTSMTNGGTFFPYNDVTVNQFDVASQPVNFHTFATGGAVGTMTGHETFTYNDGNVFIKDPGGAARNFNPSGSGFSTLHPIILVNTADAAETITFDSAGLNQAVAQNERGIFVYNGSAWLKVYVGS